MAVDCSFALAWVDWNLTSRCLETNPQWTRNRMITGLVCGLLILGLWSSMVGVRQPARGTSSLVYPQSHVASTSDLTLYESSFQNFGFYTQGRHWVFYEDSAVNCEGMGGCL